MNSNNNPYIDPSNLGSLAGTLRFAFSQLLKDTAGMLPAQVVSYDRSTNRASVQLLISMITSGGEVIPRQQLAEVPVFVYGGGGFIFSVNLNPGDLGWIIVNDRDISKFLSTYAQTTPNTHRVKSYSDGVFFPDAMKGYTINSSDQSNLVIQNSDGSVKVSLSSNAVTVQASTQVNITAPTIALNGAISSMSAPSGGTTTLTGNLAVVGNITATGSITPNV